MDKLDNDKLKNDNLLFKFIPFYSVLPICMYIFVYCFCYFGAGFIISCYNFKIHYIILFIDNYIPYMSLFVIPYCIFYPYIILGPILISKFNEYYFYRFILAGIIGSIIGGISFLVKPTGIMITEIIPSNFLDNIMLFLRNRDKFIGRACPSFHCFLSVLVFIGISSIKNIKYEIKVKSFIITFFIILSTVFTKQHYIIDSISGILLAVISWNLAKNEKYIEMLKNIFKKINDKKYNK